MKNNGNAKKASRRATVNRLLYSTDELLLGPDHSISETPIRTLIPISKYPSKIKRIMAFQNSIFEKIECNFAAILLSSLKQLQPAKPIRNIA